MTTKERKILEYCVFLLSKLGHSSAAKAVAKVLDKEG